MKRTFKLYVKTSCPYCHMASKLIADNEMVYECHALDNQRELLQEVQAKHNWKTAVERWEYALNRIKEK